MHFYGERQQKKGLRSVCCISKALQKSVTQSWHLYEQEIYLNNYLEMPLVVLPRSYHVCETNSASITQNAFALKRK